jgi:A/G-specific adenine glycosylase
LGNDSFSALLLAWWDEHGRKDLPWQHPRSPYRVWVSEIMLQQTQVKTVIPYFDRFINRFPDIQSLASATTDDVLSQWSGLGYYARARNLQKAARICVDEHDGELPQDPGALLALPGIGESTANAIYSQAHDIPAVILDGNVKRVLARYFAVEGWPGKSETHRKLWNFAAELLPGNRGADYSQAIMDLGATLCTRGKPACGECPLRKTCKAFRNDAVALFPASRPRPKISKKSFRMLVLINAEGQVLLERRPPSGIWGGLWSLPADDDGRPLHTRFSIKNGEFLALSRLKHQLTHIQMDILPLICHSEPVARGVECASDQSWFGPDEWPALGLPKPVRQILETQEIGKT